MFFLTVPCYDYGLLRTTAPAPPRTRLQLARPLYEASCPGRGALPSVFLQARQLKKIDVAQLACMERDPEGPYTLPLWNSALKNHPQYGFGDLIIIIAVYMDPLGEKGL